ncbi:MAG: 6-pyruvoyltetrahydropterin/6-carboxytetrahydropterin synthase [Arenicella sp.]|jgi:6-pyruvoyltetrahydropterin/6-carboxytetrahydropterin synthase
MNRLTTIEIEKQYLHFSVAHFTVFSATSRERLHGHNFRIAVRITGEVDANGLCFDYAIYKEILQKLCARYDEYTLIAEKSPHLEIIEEGDFYHVKHNHITMPLLKAETLLLPIRNVTIEEMSHYLLYETLGDFKLVDQLKIVKFEMRVSSGPDQWGVAQWLREA